MEQPKQSLLVFGEYPQLIFIIPLNPANVDPLAYPLRMSLSCADPHVAVLSSAAGVHSQNSLKTSATRGKGCARAGLQGDTTLLSIASSQLSKVKSLFTIWYHNLCKQTINKGSHGSVSSVNAAFLFFCRFGRRRATVRASGRCVGGRGRNYAVGHVQRCSRVSRRYGGVVWVATQQLHPIWIRTQPLRSGRVLMRRGSPILGTAIVPRLKTVILSSSALCSASCQCRGAN